MLRLISSALKNLRSAHPRHPEFPGSAAYWEKRYLSGGNSGAGSYDKFAEFKAEFLNRFVQERGVGSVIEFGSGDGNQLQYAAYGSYIGVDVSHKAVELCRSKFAGDPSKTFLHTSEFRGQRADLALSLDVIYHLIEDSVFDRYMETLFASAEAYVIIYSSNYEESSQSHGAHVRHREFTKWVSLHRPDWRLTDLVKNRYPFTGQHLAGTFADFFVYEKAR
jgi:hypothetical protein